MDPLQTVFGIFENTAEAQQAVQLLLAKGFTQDTVAVSTQPHQKVTPGRLFTVVTDADRSSGRFLVSLFGERQPTTGPGQSSPGESTPGPSSPGPSSPGPSSPGNMLVMVQAQSGAEARQVADLLERAGSAGVTVRDGKMP